jgi:hypothetical protein
MLPMTSAFLRRFALAVLAAACLSTFSCVMQPVDGSRVADRERAVPFSGYGTQPMAGIEVQSFDYKSGRWLPLAFTRTDPVPAPVSPVPGTSVVPSLHEWSVTATVPLAHWRPVAYDGARITWSTRLRAQQDGQTMLTFDAEGVRCLTDRAGQDPPEGEDPVLWYANCSTGTAVNLEARTASEHYPEIDWYASFGRAQLVASVGKRILYYVTAPGCSACDYMEHHVHTDADVRRVAFESYVAVKYNAGEHDNDVCPVYDAEGHGGTPTTCVVRADGTLLEMVVGAPTDPAVYAALLRRHAP